MHGPIIIIMIIIVTIVIMIIMVIIIIMIMIATMTMLIKHSNAAKRTVLFMRENRFTYVIIFYETAA